MEFKTWLTKCLISWKGRELDDMNKRFAVYNAVSKYLTGNLIAGNPPLEIYATHAGYWRGVSMLCPMTVWIKK